MMPKIKILILEHDANDIELIRYELDLSGLKYVTKIVENEKDFTAALEKFIPDIILSDYSLPAFNGYNAVEIKEKMAPDTPFIFVSGTVNEENAVELMKHGVTDYALKDKLFTLPQKIIRALKDAREKKEKGKNEQQREFDSNNLTALINNTKDSMWSVDRDFKLITANIPFDLSIKFALGRIIAPGTNVLSPAFPPETIARYKAFYERAFAGETFSVIDQHTVPAELWLEISFYPIREGTKVIGTACHSRDITERKKSENQIRNFAKHVTNVLEEERTHLAREVHDELGQQLVGIKIGLSLLSKNKDNFDMKIKGMIESVDETIHSLRKISTDLRPSILDTLGLVPSIKWLASEFERKTGIKCYVHVNTVEQKFTDSISICFFRICQEALTNVTKHAKASEVNVSVTQNENELSLKLSDNGKGILLTKLENPFSMGLLGMRERANIIGGSLMITSKLNEGTTVLLKANCSI